MEVKLRSLITKHTLRAKKTNSKETQQTINKIGNRKGHRRQNVQMGDWEKRVLSTVTVRIRNRLRVFDEQTINLRLTQCSAKQINVSHD